MKNNNFASILDQLVHERFIEIDLYGNTIQMKTTDNKSKIFLSSIVYNGGNYIPKSVRACIGKKEHPHSSMNTSVTIDESNFQISLNYKGNGEFLNSQQFHELLEEFCFLVDEWRNYLDEHDRHDLVYVFAK